MEKIYFRKKNSFRKYLKFYGTSDFFSLNSNSFEITSKEFIFSMRIYPFKKIYRIQKNIQVFQFKEYADALDQYRPHILKIALLYKQVFGSFLSFIS